MSPYTSMWTTEGECNSPRESLLVTGRMRGETQL